MGKYFGTDGIRGKSPEWLSPEIAYKVGYALGNKLNAKTVIIGRDTRKSGLILNQALNQGAIDAGCNTTNLGIVSTPMVQFLSFNQKTFGIMITASHNPASDNGIKVLSRGIKTSKEQESLIEEVIEGNTIISNDFSIFKENNDLLGIYFSSIEALNIPNSSIKVVLDTAHGSLSPFAESILDNYCMIGSVIGNQPNGSNINENIGSTHIKNLQSQTPRGFIGFSFDGDGDRLIAVDETGKVITGDQLLALINHYQKISSKIVLTQMVNPGIKVSLKELGYEIIETRVGDKYVLDSMKETNTDVGGEDSGHMIFNQFWPMGDGIISALIIIKTLHEKSLTLYEASQKFSKYPEELINFEGFSKERFHQNKQLQETILLLQNLIEKDEGKLLIRPSGTEDVIRVYISTKQKPRLDYFINEIKSVFESFGGRL